MDLRAYTRQRTTPDVYESPTGRSHLPQRRLLPADPFVVPDAVDGQTSAILRIIDSNRFVDSNTSFAKATVSSSR